MSEQDNTSKQSSVQEFFLRSHMNQFLVGFISLNEFVAAVEQSSKNPKVFTTYYSGYKKGSFVADYIELMNDNNHDHMAGLDSLMKYVDASKDPLGKASTPKSKNSSIVQEFASNSKWKAFYSVLSKEPDAFKTLKTENMIDAYAVAAGENDLKQMSRFLEMNFDPTLQNKKNESALSLYLQKTKQFSAATVSQLLTNAKESAGDNPEKFSDFINAKGTGNAANVSPLGHILYRYNKTLHRRTTNSDSENKKSDDLYQLKISLNNMLTEGANPNFQTKTGMTPLMYAASKGLPEDIVSDLMSAGASHNWVSSRGKTALSSAAAYGNMDALKSFLDVGALPGGFPDANHFYLNDSRPIISAAKNGHWDIVEELIERGADVNTLNSHGENLLSMAIDSDLSNKPKQNIIQMLYNKGVNANQIDQDEQTALQKLGGHFKTELSHAAESGNINKVKILLSEGKNPNGSFNKASVGLGNTTPIISAAMKGHWDIVFELAENGADVNTLNNDGQSLLFIAIDSDLISEKRDGNLISSKSEKYKVIEKLLDKGVNSETIDHKENTVLTTLGNHCIKNGRISNFNFFNDVIQLVGNKTDITKGILEWKNADNDSLQDMLRNTDGSEKILGFLDLMIDAAQKADLINSVGKDVFNKFEDEHDGPVEPKTTAEDIIRHTRQKQRTELKKREKDAKEGLEIMGKALSKNLVSYIPIIAVAGVTHATDAVQMFIEQAGGSYVLGGVLAIAAAGQAYLNIPKEKRQKVWTAVDYYSKKVIGFAQDRLESPGTAKVINYIINVFNGTLGVFSKIDNNSEVRNHYQVGDVTEGLGATSMEASNDPIGTPKIDPNLQINVVNIERVSSLFAPDSEYTKMMGELGIEDIMKFEDVILLICECHENDLNSIKTNVTDQRISDFIGSLGKNTSTLDNSNIENEPSRNTDTESGMISESVKQENREQIADRLLNRSNSLTSTYG